MSRDRAERDRHGHHGDDQPGAPRPAQDPKRQAEHYDQADQDQQADRN